MYRLLSRYLGFVSQKLAKLAHRLLNYVCTQCKVQLLGHVSLQLHSNGCETSGQAHNIRQRLHKVLEGDGAVVCDSQICQHTDAVWLEGGSGALQGGECAGQAPILAVTHLQNASIRRRICAQLANKDCQSKHT